MDRFHSLSKLSNVAKEAVSKTRNWLNSTTASFSRNDDGAVVTIFAVAAIPMFLIAGLAVDYSRMAHTRSVIDDSLDAALLSAGAQLSKGNASVDEIREDFEDFFMANVEARTNYAKNISIVNFEADPETGRVSGSASSDVRMAFMGLAGFNTVNVNTASEAVFSIDEIELSMMLDLTGSMGGSKIAALKEAAEDAVDILLSDNNAASGKVRIGLVPYAASVNPGPQIARKVTNYQSNKCVTERTGPYALTDNPHTDGFIGTHPQAYCPNNKVLPLTNKKNKLVNEIRNFSTNGWTAGHLGIAWSYYMLSEEWQNVWPAASKPAPYGGKTTKVALLMTDGEFNTFYSTGGNPFNQSATIAASNDTAEGMCEDMKDKGIIVYSVAFEAPASAQAVLQACANENTPDTNYYFNADNPAELKSAFQEIALSIQKLRLSK